MCSFAATQITKQPRCCFQLLVYLWFISRVFFCFKNNLFPIIVSPVFFTFFIHYTSLCLLRWPLLAKRWFITIHAPIIIGAWGKVPTHRLGIVPLPCITTMLGPLGNGWLSLFGWISFGFLSGWHNLYSPNPTYSSIFMRLWRMPHIMNLLSILSIKIMNDGYSTPSLLGWCANVGYRVVISNYNDRSRWVLIFLKMKEIYYYRSNETSIKVQEKAKVQGRQ